MLDTFKKLMFARQISFEEGKITLLSQPIFITPAQTFISLYKHLIDELGINKANEILYNASKDAGLKYTSAIKKSYSMSKVDMIKWAANSITLSGWGKVNVVKVDGQQNFAVITVNESTFAKLWGKSSGPVDVILAGFFAGGESAVFEKNIDVEETKCIAKGDSNCVFVVKNETKSILKMS